MKASDLIRELEAAIDKYGDLDLLWLSRMNGCNDADNEFAVMETGQLRQQMGIYRDKFELVHLDSYWHGAKGFTTENFIFIGWDE